MIRFSPQQKRILYLSALGGFLEFYDFTIYTIFAAYFSKLFFPASNTLFSLLAAYSVFFIGYVIRPIGGIIFSHIGDEYGRKLVMVLTMVLMGIASFGIGVLPTYATIGVAAPILLLFFRLLQGLAFGGEVPSIIIYIRETINLRKAVAVAFVFALLVSGLLPGMLLHLGLTHILSKQQISDYGWRIGFILGGVVCFISYQVRKKLHETEAFKNLHCKPKYPFILLMRSQLHKVFIGIILIGFMAITSTLATLFMPTYLLVIIKSSSKYLDNAVVCGILSDVIAIYLVGYVIDRFNVIKIMLINIILLMLITPVVYWLIEIQFNLIFTLSLFGFFVGLVVTPTMLILGQLFPTNVSLSGVAFSYNLGYIIFGGLCPLMLIWAITKFAHIYLTPVIMVWISGLISIYAVSKCSRQLIN